MNKRKNTITLLFIATLLICLIVGIIAYLNEKRLKNNHLYTIGRTTKVWYVNFRYEYDYYFYVDSIKYEDRSKYTDMKPKDVLGKMFYIEFEIGNPQNSNILFDKAFIDTTIHLPSGGIKYIYEIPYLKH